MNEWNIRKIAIVEADDFCDRYDRNGLNFLFYWKAKYPKFKITLFTIPEKTTPKILFKLSDIDLCEFAVHGWNHESNFECYGWDYEKTINYINRADRLAYYQKIFKSPGWSITPGNNGYPANPKDLINKDPQAVYKALKAMDFIIMDRHYNKAVRPAGCKIICVDCNPDIVHMHTWNMMGVKEEDRNGFEQVEERGVPWDNNTEFYTIDEAWYNGLIKECHD
jgi:hypothetical protein